MGGALRRVLAPVGSVVTILTDSMSVVRAARRVLRARKAQLRPLVRSVCCVEWDGIKLIVEEQRLKAKLRWVKGHAGNVGNESADRLANSGAASDQPRAQVNPAFGHGKRVLTHQVAFDGDVVSAVRLG